jgi:hypothetical protein
VWYCLCAVKTTTVASVSDCEDARSMTNCALIVKAGLCTHERYGRYCCATCRRARDDGHYWCNITWLFAISLLWLPFQYDYALHTQRLWSTSNEIRASISATCELFYVFIVHK